MTAALTASCAALTPRKSPKSSTSTSSGSRGQARRRDRTAQSLPARSRVPAKSAREITPKNILMIGPTGVGKTEIARRLASLVGAPFVKVEATKYTEVGYVGRDVESMVRDLVEVAVRMVTDARREEVRDVAERASRRARHRRAQPETRPPQAQTPGGPFAATLGSIFGNAAPQQPQQAPAATLAPAEAQRVRDQTREEVERGFYDVRLVEIEVEESPALPIGVIGGMGDQSGADLGEMLGGMLPKRKTRKRVTVAEARRIFAQEEAAKLIDVEAVKREALRRAGEDGIIFIDEIDKVAGAQGGAAVPTSRAKACSATSFRSWKARR